MKAKERGKLQGCLGFLPGYPRDPSPPRGLCEAGGDAGGLGPALPRHTDASYRNAREREMLASPWRLYFSTSAFCFILTAQKRFKALLGQLFVILRAAWVFCPFF